MEHVSSSHPAALAAGSQEAVDAGEQILRSGGNAVDAAIAGVLTSFASEPVLTGPFGGGFAMVASPGAAPKNYQFFAQTPGIGLPVENDIADFVGLECKFGPASQLFHVGKGSVALPLMIPGLLQLHEEQGALPWSTLVEPAIRIAQQGILLSDQMAGILEILKPILSHTAQAKALFCPGGQLLKAGERFASPDLPEFLTQLSQQNLGQIYGNLLTDFAAPTGLFQAADLEHQRILTPPPLEYPLQNTRIFLNAPPSSGGVLIAFGLKILERVSGAIWQNPTESFRHFLAVLATTQKARLEYIDDELAQGGDDWLMRILSPQKMASYQEHFNDVLNGHLSLGLKASEDLGHTTHISVLDSNSMACSITTSNGEGCGHIASQSGCMANNFMGEADLHPNGFHQLRAGEPLTSMMCPTIVTRDNRPILVLGSGGSNRIRSALLQVLVRHLLGGSPLAQAVTAPRIHYEGGEITLEKQSEEQHVSPKTLDALENMAGPLTLFDKPNIFFGGVHAVGADGSGIGDKRRSGVATVIE